MKKHIIKKELFFSLITAVLLFTVVIIQADPSNWENLVDDGFDGTTNYSTRAIEIYNDELYVGTESLNKFVLGGSVEGTVYGLHDDGTTTPLSNAQVHVGLQTVTTESDGTYTIGNLIFEIQYPVTASKSGYDGQTLSATPTTDDPVIILNFILEEDGGGGGGGGSANGSISGTVYGKFLGSEIPLAYARVQTSGGTVYTNMVGQYTIEDLPLGIEYSVTASKHRYVPKTKQVELSYENPQGSCSFLLERKRGGGGNGSFEAQEYISQYSYETYDSNLYSDDYYSDYFVGQRIPIGSQELVYEQYLGESGGGVCSMSGDDDVVFEFGTLMWFPNIQSLGLQLAMHARSIASNGGELWKYNDDTGVWTPLIANKPDAVMDAGFDYSHNLAISSMKVFNGKLYIGTWSTPGGLIGSWPRKGCEIWRYDGSTFEQVVGHQATIDGGFGEPKNIAAWKMEVFNDYLYVGTMNWDRTSEGQCQIWRTNDGESWEQVVDKGFRDVGANEEVLNTYLWNMEAYQDQLYVGTFNSQNNEPNAGTQIWKTSDGTTWNKMNLPGGDGFGEPENYGIRSMAVFNNELFVGIAASAFQLDDGDVEALEIWKYDGSTWTPIVGDDVAGAEPDDPFYDGFGNHYNKYAWSMEVSNGKLWIGTANTQFVTDTPIFDNQGCEIWCYDGSLLTPVIKDDVGDLPNGFGKTYNVGGRSMIEYPQDSGKLYIGTFKLKSFRPWISEEGCDVWRYIS